MVNRRKAREYAFTLLFSYRFQPEDVQTLLDDFFAEHETGDQAEYIRTVVEGVVAHIEEIDALITQYAKGWTTDRISGVCLALLRLAVYEMNYMDDIPAGVSVNEAVALAKIFDGEESLAFVNGILGHIKDDK